MSKRILTVWPENDYRFYLQHNDEDMKYGLPNKKKYPMPDRDHVMSAIKFFNYVSPSDEKELARNIIARIREYGIEDINVGENNRFGKYYNSDSYLAHHGILGMRWGVRRYQNTDGSLTTAGKKRLTDSESQSSKKQGRFDRSDWNPLAVITARKDYKKIANHDASKAIRAKYEKAVSDLEKRQMKEGSEVDWGSPKGRAMESRHFDEMYKLRTEATNSLLVSKLIEAGYSKESAKAGANWMMENGYNISITDTTWGGLKNRR